MDCFEFEAVDLLEITEVRTGHDGKGSGAGWYLDRVMVREADNPEKEFAFQCDR